MSFGYGLHFRDELDEPVSREFDALIARMKAFFEVSFNEDGTLKSGAVTQASSTEQAARDEDHWWRRGAWTFDDPRQASTAYRIGLRPPKTPTGTYHNYAPDGIDEATILEIEPDAGDVTLTGIRHESTSGTKRLLLLRNRDSGNNLTLADNDSGSFDRYQFDLPNNEDLVMGPGNSSWLYYDPGRDGGRWTAAITKNVSGGLASTPATVFELTTSITEAQLEAMGTTPIIIVPQPAVGQMIFLVSFLVETLLTVVYTNNPQYRVRYVGKTGNSYAGVGGVDWAPGFNAGPNNKFSIGGPIQGTVNGAGTDLDNRAIQIDLSANLTGAGTATVKVHVVYAVVTTGL